MGWTTDGPRSVHTVTGAHSMREHRERKRDQAEVRNEMTSPERRRRYRYDTEYRDRVRAEKSHEFLKSTLPEEA